MRGQGVEDAAQPYIRVWWVKTRRGTSRVSNTSPRPDHTPSQLLVVETTGGWGGRRSCWFLRRVYLKGPHGPRMFTNPPTLGSTTRAGIRKVLVLEVGEVTGNEAGARQASRTQAAVLSFICYPLHSHSATKR